VESSGRSCQSHMALCSESRAT